MVSCKTWEELHFFHSFITHVCFLHLVIAVGLPSSAASSDGLMQDLGGAAPTNMDIALSLLQAYVSIVVRALCESVPWCV